MLFCNFVLFPIPCKEPYQRNYKHDDAARVGYRRMKAESLLRNEQEGRADHCHEKCWNECDDKRLTLLHEIDGDGPKCEDGHCLVGPAEILPYYVETIRIFHLPDEYA